MSAHSWENPANLHSWSHLDGDADDLGDFWGECSDDDGPDEQTNTPGDTLVALLLDHMLCSRLSAHQCCTLMYWAEKAGVQAAKPFALRPEANSGHASRKLRKALGHVGSTDLYELEVPGHARRDLERSSHLTPVMPLHEQLVKSMEKEVGILTQLAEHKASGDVPPAYTDHRVVRENPDELVVPIALFVDAVPYSHTDSVLGFWGMHVLSGQRFLYAVVRKRHVCRCGCKGWCTYSAMFSLTAWSLDAMARGVWPSARHDGGAFRTSDSTRSQRAGSAMPCKFACIYIKGDWAEYSHTLGLPSWNDGLRPCFACAGFGDDLYVAAGNGPGSLRWDCNKPGDFEQACLRCERKVQINTVADRACIAGALRYDKRAAGGNGRCLGTDMHQYSLNADDRLEPSPSLPDVGTFELQTPPFEVTMWRRSLESLCRHRNPLWSDSLGLSAERSLTVDTLHALYLGVMNVWCRTAVWKLVMSGVYGSTGASDDGLTSCCLAMRHALFAWYSARRRRFPDEGLTKLNDLTPAMVGSRTSPKCKTKAAETWCFLLFLVDELNKFGPRLGEHWQRLVAAGRNLEEMVLVWRTGSWTLSAAAIEATAQVQNKRPHPLTHPATQPPNHVTAQPLQTPSRPTMGTWVKVGGCG